MITLSLTPPGNRKTTKNYSKYFEFALGVFSRKFASTLNLISQLEDAAGYQALFSLKDTGSNDLHKMKSSLVEFEENYIFSILDADIVSLAGGVKRGALKLPPRPCIICNWDAKGCSQQRAHTVSQVRNAYLRRVRRVLALKRTKKVLGAELRSALLSELVTTPKPGMVDLLGRGIHRDMDVEMFINSVEVLAKSLPDLFGAGFSNVTFAEESLQMVRRVGLPVEKRMYKATGNVNTHKGALFLFAVVFFALGQLNREKEKISRKGLSKKIAAICRGLTGELEAFDLKSASGKVYRETGKKGIRGELEMGMPSVFRVLKHDFQHSSLNELNLRRFLMLFKNAEDTQAYKKVPADKLDEFKETIQPESKTIAGEMARFSDFVEKWRFSAGGTADLLAMVIFLAKWLPDS